MKKIFLIFLISSLLYSGDFRINLLKKNNPLAYKKALSIEKIKNNIKSQKGGDIVYCLVSASVSVEYMKKVIFEISSLTPNTGTKLVFVAQGFFSKGLLEKYNSLQKDLREYSYCKLFQSNSELIADPAIFKKFKIKKVPAILYGTFLKSSYSSDSNISYIARGDILPNRFFHLISTKDIGFEKYTHIISLIY
jgi:hypothetical protein